MVTSQVKGHVKGKWSLSSIQFNEGFLKVNRSIKVISRSMILSREKGHFRSMKVISRSRVIAMVTLKVKVISRSRINEGHVKGKGHFKVKWFQGQRVTSDP